MGTRRTVAALGMFDGVHVGHRCLLELALLKLQDGMDSAIFTFRPDAVFRKKSGSEGFIYSYEEKQRILEDCGFDKIYSPSFSELCDMSGEEFVKNILVDKMRVAAVCCGEDFRFGKNASWGVDELRKFGEKYCFEVFVAKTVTLEDTVVSSGKIRRFLLDGDIKKANLFLDAPYTITKKIVKGNQIGRTIGFPTANQLFDEGQLVPKFGVYASEIIVNSRTYNGITNIGVKPTVEYDGRPLAETNVFGLERDLYECEMQVRLIDFIRPECEFASLDELKAQIQNDIKAAEKILV